MRGLTPLERRAIESRDLRSSYDNAYRAVLTVFQDKGYSITNSDYDSGIIRATSGPQTSVADFILNELDFADNRYNNHEVTVTLEKYTDEITKIRIVIKQHMYDSDRRYLGAALVDMPEALHEYYSAIQKEIFMREQMGKS
jgi:hypothetical protein